MPLLPKLSDDEIVDKVKTLTKIFNSAFGENSCDAALREYYLGRFNKQDSMSSTESDDALDKAQLHPSLMLGFLYYTLTKTGVISVDDTQWSDLCQTFVNKAHYSRTNEKRSTGQLSEMIANLETAADEFVADHSDIKHAKLVEPITSQYRSREKSHQEDLLRQYGL